MVSNTTGIIIITSLLLLLLLLIIYEVGLLSDLWKYEPLINKWTHVSGSLEINQDATQSISFIHYFILYLFIVIFRYARRKAFRVTCRQ